MAKKEGSVPQVGTVKKIRVKWPISETAQKIKILKKCAAKKVYLATVKDPIEILFGISTIRYVGLNPYVDVHRINYGIHEGQVHIASIISIRKQKAKKYLFKKEIPIKNPTIEPE